jgi:hypothetical protein
LIAGGLQMDYVPLQGPFAANRTYYVRCEKRNDAVVAWIAEKKHGDASLDFGGGGGTAIPMQPVPAMPADLDSLQSPHGDNAVNPPPASDHGPAPQATPPRD